MASRAVGDAPLIWAVHDGKLGMASQVLGLAEAVGGPVVEKRLVIRAPWRHLLPQLWLQPLSALDPGGDGLAPPWPDILIACGRNTIAPALAVKTASAGRTLWVQIQDPHFARDRADLLIVPQHDPARGANVFATLGAVHRVTPARLAAGAGQWAPRLAHLPQPRVAVLIGGSNRAFRISAAQLARLAEQLAALARRGLGVMVTPSRRTGETGMRLLRERLAGLPAFLWDGSGDNPYFGMLALADAILVTADSVSMVSEAAATGKPVHILGLDGGSAKFARFHAALAAAGITRPFRGAIEHWSYAPPEDTARAAAAIRERLARRWADVA